MSKTLYRKRSRYQDILLTRRPDGKIYLTLDSAYQFLSGRDEKIYHYKLATAPAIKLGRNVNALILGGGDGLAARNLVALPCVRKVTLVELDPDMIAMASTVPEMRKLNRDVFRDPKLETVVGDAASFVRKYHPELWNLIIVDFPDPVPQIESLYSESFYRDVVQHMDGLRGILSIQASDVLSIAKRVVNVVQTVTHLPAKIVAFDGEESMGGYVVRGGPGSL